MTRIEFDGIILRLVKAGIEITLRWDDNKMIYDLNTGMKSHLHIFWDQDSESIHCLGRYNHQATVDTWESLLRQVKYCMHGRDFANFNWIGLLIEAGILEEIVSTTVSYR